MTESSKRVCIVCDSTNGYLKDASENWSWLYGIGHIGPFCNQSCVDRWNDMSTDHRAAVAVGGDIAWDLKLMQERYEAGQPAYSTVWDTVPPVECPPMEVYPDIITLNGEKQERYPIKGLARGRLTLVKKGGAE